MFKSRSDNSSLFEFKYSSWSVDFRLETNFEVVLVTVRKTVVWVTDSVSVSKTFDFLAVDATFLDKFPFSEAFLFGVLFMPRTRFNKHKSSDWILCLIGNRLVAEFLIVGVSLNGGVKWN